MVITQNINLSRYNWASDSIDRYLDKVKLNEVYDIGARDSILKSYLHSSNIHYKGFDLEPLNDEVRKWNLENEFPFPNEEKADLVCLLEIVEHLNNPWLAIRNLSDVLKPGGYLFLTTPNPLWSRSRISLLFKGFLTCFTQSDLDLNHHVFTPWPHIIERLLKDNGFEIIEYSTLDGKTQLFRKPLKYYLPLQLLFRTILILIEKLDKKSCGMSYAILAKKIN
jgi:SAM-dependent methyltransferase